MAIAFGAVTKGKDDGTVSSLTFTGPTVSGSNTIGLVHIITNNASDDIVTGVTWGGSNMTRIAIRDNNGGTQNAFAYYITNPSSAASVVSSCSTTSDGMYGHALYYTGAQQTGQPDSSNTGFATGDLTLSTTVVASDCWLVSVARNDVAGIPGAGTGTTIRENDAAHAMATGDSNGTVGTGSQSMGWTAASGTTWGIIYSIVPFTESVASRSSKLFTLMGVGN